MRILVVQMDNEPDINLIVFKMIDKAAAARIPAKRPAHSMNNKAFLMLFRRNFP